MRFVEVAVNEYEMNSFVNDIFERNDGHKMSLKKLYYSQKELYFSLIVHKYLGINFQNDEHDVS